LAAVLKPGRLLGNYRIDGVLGQGGMGIVYEATQLSLQRTVALKVIGADVSADASFRERFRLEGLIQAALDHPHIVTVFEAGEHERNLFIAMRLVRGPTLKDMIIARDLDAGRALRILAPIGDALDTAHAAGLIHRDVKPQNILVGPRDHAYLADFGLMKPVGQRGLTRTGQFVGSIDYIAPEQINSEEATARTDVYALGAVLFEALTGIVPYPKASDAAVLYAHMSDDPPRVTDQRPELPVALDRVIAAAMAKSPEDRPASAAQLLRQAERAFGRPTRAAMRKPGPFENPEEAGVRPPEARVSTVESQRKLQPPPASERTASRALAPAPAARTPTHPPGASQRADPPGRRDEPGAETVDERDQVRRAPTPVVLEPRPRGSRHALALHGLRRPWSAVALLVAILATCGYLVGRSSVSDARGDARRVGAGGISIVLPRGWARSGRATPPPGLRFGRPLLTATAVSPPDYGLVAGIVPDAVGSDLIPASFAHRLRASARVGTAVRLRRLEGLRYNGVGLRGTSRAVNVFAVSTSRSGAAIVACYGPGSNPAPRVLDACSRSAASLEVDRDGAYPLGPDAGYAARLGAILTAFGVQRVAGRKALKDAGERDTQASAADALARAAAKAARAAAAMTTSARDREAHGALVRGFTASRDGYVRMASAARTADREHFASGAADVRRAEATIASAMSSLAKLGYKT
jgi:serine/threonine protein kinase